MKYVTDDTVQKHHLFGKSGDETHSNISFKNIYNIIYKVLVPVPEQLFSIVAYCSLHQMKFQKNS